MGIKDQTKALFLVKNRTEILERRWANFEFMGLIRL